MKKNINLQWSTLASSKDTNIQGLSQITDQQKYMWFELTRFDERLWWYTNIIVIRGKLVALHIFRPLCFVLSNRGHAVRHDFVANWPARPNWPHFERWSADWQVVWTQEKSSLTGTIYGHDIAEEVDLQLGVSLRQMVQRVWEHCHFVRQVALAERDFDRLAARAGSRIQDR